MESVSIPSSVFLIDGHAFSGCSRLKSVTVPKTVEVLQSYAFENCTSLESLTIANGLQTIGDYAFLNCTALKSLTIPNSVTEISGYAFSESGLTNITIPNYVESIGFRAFSNCADLRTVSIRDGLTDMGSFAFASCPLLTTVTIADCSTVIGTNAFYNCAALTSVSIPQSVTTIGSANSSDDDPVDDCKAFDARSVSLVIYGKSGSFAQRYANANNITFGAIKLPTSITLSKTSLSLMVGESKTITATVLPADATDKTVTWTSSKTSVATVSNGKITAKAAGTATITAKTVNGKTATCKVTVTAPPAAPVISVSNSAAGLKAAWAAVDNATSYEVHYKASSDSSWTKVTTTDTSYVINGAVSGKLYYVKVKSIKGSYKSDSSATKSITYIAQGNITSLTYSGSAINAKWSKVGGATKYQIAYKKNGDSSFTTKTTTGTAFALSNVTAGTSYTFKVRAQLEKDSSTTSGAWSEEKTVVTLAKPTITTARVSSDKKGIYISWKAVPGAKKYKVYYKTSSDSTWTIKYMSSLSYTIKNAAKGKVYSIRVCAYNDAGSGALSPVTTVTMSR